MEQALYIIKPEGMANRKEIHQMILDAGLKIILSKCVLLNNLVLNTIYPNLSPDLLDATIRFLTKAPSEIGVVEGENAIEKLRELIGEQTNPDECRPGTIRHRFGVRPSVVVGKSIYHLNVLHRSKTVDEARRELDLYDRVPAITDSPTPNVVSG
jgi:nucleoside-diphosphate kinase